MKKILPLFFSLLFSTFTFSQTLLVPSQFSTIQAAINASNNGDTVLISSGIYFENINYSGKNIVLGSHYISTGDRSYVESTIIDGNQLGSVVTFNSGENSSAKLIGLTIQNGDNTDGGGIFCDNSCSPSLENLNIINNNADELGGGVYLDVAANATLKYCLISDNTASGSNGNGGGLAGVGLFLNPVIQNCTFANNSAWESGNGIYVNPANPNTTNIQIINSILWNNQLLSNGTYEEISSQQNGSTQQTDPNFTVSYSLVRGGWSGTSIINTNPMFVDPSNGNFNLLYQSPCVNAGNPSSIYNDPDGSISDLGAFPINTINNGTTFSTIKSGDYFDPCIWSQNSVPSIGDSIYVNHNISFSNNLYFLNNYVSINYGVEMCGYSSIIVDWNTDINVFGNLKSGNIQLYANLNIWGNVTASSLSILSGGSVNYNGGGLSFSSFTCSPIPNFTTLSPITICNGDSALIFGSYVGVSGGYWDTTQATGGCDSIIYQELIVQSYNDTISQTICDGDSLLFGTQYFSSDTLITQTFVSSIGCDSIVTIDLSLAFHTNDTITQNICDYGNNSNFYWDGIYYDSTGFYTNFYSNINGCDSIVTLDLTVYNNSYTVLNIFECDSFVFDTTTYYSSGTYWYPYIDQNGCDSVFQIDLTIANSFSTTTTVTACDSFLWNGITYDSSGIYTNSYTMSSGCDSNLILDLTINNTFYSTFEIDTCDCYEWDAIPYCNTDTITNLYSTQNGCDSIVTLYLNIGNSYQYDTAIACNSYFWQDSLYTISDIHYANYTSGDGCDSVFILDLIIIYSDTSYIFDSSCDSIIYSGTTYDSSGIYYYSYTNSFGCIDTEVLDFTIIPPPIATISYDGVFLEANNAANYYWNTGETSDIIQPQANGIYWCIIEDINGCISDTAFFEVTNIVGVHDFTSIRELDVHPNPSRDVFNISFNSDEIQDLTIRILNIVGAEFFREEKQSFVGEYIKQISLDNYDKGIYFLEIETKTGTVNKKLILQ